MLRVPGSLVKAGRNRTTFPASTPAPSSGLNTRDPQSQQAPTYAVNLTNWVADPNGVAVREGYTNFCTGITGYVNTLLSYSTAGPYSNKLFAAAGSKIVEVTNGGTAITTGSSTMSGLLNDQWSYVNFTGAAGHYLVAANGADAVRHWDGAAWTTWTLVGSPTAPGQVSGIDPSKFESVIVHQKRLWFVQANSTVAWYLPINSIGGAAVAFDFGANFSRGGKLVALTSWSNNGGVGPQNYLVAISSMGDTVVYSGTDPSSSTAWNIVATWPLGQPVSNRCFMPFGGDTLLLSQDGLVPLAKYMQATTTQVALTDSIRSTIADLTNSQQGLPGFQIVTFLARNIVLLNVPQINPETNVQFVYNTITGGWSLFQGWPAQCWATFGRNVYFGANGRVCQAFNGYKDNANADGSGGDVYTATAQQSFNAFEKPGQKKRFVRAKVNMQTAAGAPNVHLNCNVDYDLTPPSNLGTALAISSATWGASIWGIARWSDGGLINFNQWQTLGAIGYAGSIVIAVSVLGPTLWISTDWEIEAGGSR